MHVVYYSKILSTLKRFLNVLFNYIFINFKAVDVLANAEINFYLK